MICFHNMITKIQVETIVVIKVAGGAFTPPAMSTCLLCRRLRFEPTVVPTSKKAI